jgi:hypothetical protein
MSSTIVVVDSLVDFKSTTREGYKTASFNLREETKRKRRNLMRGASKATVADKGKAKFMGAQRKGTKLNFTCFICDGPHFAREYLKRENLNVIWAGDNDENEGVVTHVNPIRVNCLVAESGDATAKTRLVDQNLLRIDAL